MGLSREYLNRGLTDKLVQAYYEYMVDIAVLLGAKRSRAEEELKESLQFEIKLANVSSIFIFFYYNNCSTTRQRADYNISTTYNF